MENELEQLLNSLIEKGWEPFREKSKSVEYLFEWNQFYFKNIPWELVWAFYRSTRELVSKDSWLWQFVCENKMEKKMEKNHRWIWINSWAKSAYQSYPVYTMERYEYRVIESSLKDESEIEDFLLSNIKVEWIS